jgi:cell division protein ZapA
MKQLEVQIMGQSYLLAAPEGGEQRLLTAVEKVDTAMCRIRDAGKVKARDRIAVLAALNLAFETDVEPQKSAPATAPTTAPVAASAASIASGGLGTDPARLQALIDKLDQSLLTRDGQLL